MKPALQCWRCQSRSGISLIPSNNLFERTRKKKRKPGQRTKEEQAVINQAKEVLMDKNNMSENEAHRYIQKSAMDSGRTMVETAEMILAIMYKE